MDINEQRVKELLSKGEGLELEFKACTDKLSGSVYETVCAFLNRQGGTILLGVQDHGDVQGVNPGRVKQLTADFVTGINNPQKLHPPTYCPISAIEVEDRTLLHVFVPVGSQVHRCNGRIYDRNGDADLDITNDQSAVLSLYQRKQAAYSENKVFPHVQPKHLRADLIDRCRRIAANSRGTHPWADMSDVDLLRSAQLLQTDPNSNKRGVTLAGIMLLAPDDVILRACPAHRTDLILRKEDTDRYDDRDLVRTNLIESYDRILAFASRHLPDPFYSEGDERVSLREIIFREVASNTLVHREYTSGEGSRMIIEYGKATIENPNRPHGHGLLDPATARPFLKNPFIAAFFREIQRAEELGSGMRKLNRYCEKYGNDSPQLIEGDIFRTIIPVPEFDAGGRVERDADSIADMLHDKQMGPYSELLAVGWRFHEFAAQPVGGVVLVRNGEQVTITRSGEIVRH